MKKRILAMLLVLMMTLPFAVSALAAEEPVIEHSDETLVMGYGAEMSNLNLYRPGGESYLPVKSNCYETLMTYNPETQDYDPCLAESWEWRDDTTLVFHVRKGVKFHSGNEMTGVDVLDTLINVYNDLGGYSRVMWLIPEECYLEDDYTVVCKTTEYCPQIIISLSGPIACVREKAFLEEYGDIDYVNGTGPYFFQSWESGVKYTLERFDDYWNAENVPCYYKYIDICFYNDLTTAFLDYEVGELDCVVVGNDTDFTRLVNEEVDDTYYVTVPQNGAKYLCFPVWCDERWYDQTLRQAVCEAIDVESLVPALCGGMYTTLDSIIPPDSWAYKSEGFMYNPEHAKELVEEYVAGGGDPVFDKNCYISMTNYDATLAEAIQEQLKAVGIDVTFEIISQADFRPHMNAGEVALSFGGGTGGWDPMDLFFPVQRGSGNMVTECLDDEVCDLIVQANSEPDHEKRVELYGQIQDMARERYLYLPFYAKLAVYAFSDSVANPTFGIEHYIYFGTMYAA